LESFKNRKAGGSDRKKRERKRFSLLKKATILPKKLPDQSKNKTMSTLP